MQKTQFGPPSNRPRSPWSTQGLPSDGPISNQMPSFAMPKRRMDFSEYREMDISLDESHDRIKAARSSSIRADDSISIADTRSISPPASILTNKSHDNKHSSQQINQSPNGIFARGQPLPLAFHVMSGSMQKLAEMTITVSFDHSIG